MMWDGVERRKGADWLDVTINVLNVLAWFVFLAALIIYHYAKPEMQYFVYNLVKEPVVVRGYWLEDLKDWLYVTLYTCITISVITVIANHLRLKRKNDQRKFSVIMVLILSLAFVGAISLV